jgi:serine protease inhibitor
MLTLRVAAVVVMAFIDQIVSAPTSEHQQYLAQTISRSHFEFSVDLYRQLVNDLSNASSSSSSSSDNLVFSPYSVHAVLSMLFMGTSSSSDSSRQLRAALHYEDVSYVDAHSAFKEVVTVLGDSYYEHKVLAANGVFVQAGVQLSQPYDRAAKEFYKASH